MLIIISPSKTIAGGTANTISSTTLPVFIDQSAELIRILRSFSLPELKDLLKVSIPLAQKSFERLMQWHLPFDSNNSFPALTSFKGDVFEGIDVSDFSKHDFRFAQDHLRILSALYGVLKPLDLMQPYRLEMETRLTTENFRNLYEFWSHSITTIINQEIAEKGWPTLLNLASQEYFKTIDLKQFKGSIITPEFREQKGTTFKVVPIHAKRARGLMSRYIIKNRIVDVEQIKLFDYEGYFFSPNLSTLQQWIFIRLSI